jgi:hypothetical protein
MAAMQPERNSALTSAPIERVIPFLFIAGMVYVGRLSDLFLNEDSPLIATTLG